MALIYWNAAEGRPYLESTSILCYLWLVRRLLSDIRKHLLDGEESTGFLADRSYGKIHDVLSGNGQTR